MKLILTRYFDGVQSDLKKKHAANKEHMFGNTFNENCFCVC